MGAIACCVGWAGRWRVGAGRDAMFSSLSILADPFVSFQARGLAGLVAVGTSKPQRGF